MNDADIVDLYWRRSDEAVIETQKKYGGYCYTIAFGFLRNVQDAEECVNDTWLKAWNAMPQNRPARLAPFIGKITRSLAFDRFRAGRARKRGEGELPLVLDELKECIPCVPSAAQIVEEVELERAVNEFLHTLPARDCNVFLRRYWYAEPLTDIAKRYGLKLNTVKTVLFRTRGKLKSFLETEGFIT
ncbi:MAG: sigma-70 family RNA polymerase sigma factor [Oscillospiraceae bacterium]|nr:sigma-70 family RNA polymerase sigma factor [Oscillospiraceae bacterium]